MSGDDIVSDEMRKLDSQIMTCELCRLSKSRTNAVPGSGNIRSPKVVFVGEAPGRNEDLQGRPFVGAGGKLLDELLKKARLEREDVYITNIVKCRPPNNRKPERDEVEICTSNYLEKQVELLKPELICTLGATALEYFTGEKKMGENHGKRLRARKSGVALLATYHPASVFRNRSLRALLQKDIEKIPKMLAKEEEAKQPES